jgi:hypothetical protein
MSRARQDGGPLLSAFVSSRTRAHRAAAGWSRISDRDDDHHERGG